MSKLLINKYYNQLHEVLNAGGTRNENSISFAFANLLRSYAEKKDLVFVPQKEAKGRGDNRVIPDGAIRYYGGLDIGYWEAKDSKDKLDDEIHQKLNVKGYPNKNIIFEDTQTAVLFQEGVEVMRVNMREWNLLDDLLNRFINYESNGIKDFRKALIEFKENVPDIVERLRELMEEEAETNGTFREVRDIFLEIARSEINPEITAEDVREMIIQHILTEDIFTNVFADAEFHRSNNIARELENVIETFMTREVRRNYLEHIKSFYNAIRDAASGITDNHEKQKFLKTVYENFYKVYNPKGADKLGVVYTPNEIVRFMIDATDWLLDKHFNKTLSDKGVDILDPATGTGTFIAELIDRINIHDLEYKYEHELHANEVAILPYYIANLNIEYTYQQRKGSYKEFKNICFVDTLDNTSALDYSGKQDMLFGISSENAKRIKDQNAKKISVIIGNPPYNAKQANYNFQNSNRAYKEIDKRVKDTYIRYGTAQNQIVVYDMFTRFYRWSMDRLNDNGVIAFVTNRTFIDSRAFDGFRQSVQNEFDSIYIVDLRSDVRANPKIAGTSHNVFGIQTGVAIAFLVKNSEKGKDKKECKIYYVELDDFWRKEKKLEWISENHISQIAFDRIEPDSKNNWINQTDNDWDSLLPLYAKEGERIFDLCFNGIQSNRDDWVYDLDKNNLESKVEFFTERYNKSVKKNEKDFTIKWTHSLEDYFKRKHLVKFDSEFIKPETYRPFFKMLHYCDKALNHRLTQNHYDVWGKNLDKPNKVINFTGIASKEFACLVVEGLINVQFLFNAVNVALYTYSENQKHENITDWALNQFRNHYGKQSVPPALAGGSTSATRNPKENKQTSSAQTLANDLTADVEPPAHAGGTDRTNGTRITKQDIFYYVYAVLHSPVYRKKYEQNLKREFPRLPFYDDFFQWAKWGAELMDLHINYESAEPFPLERNDLKKKPKQNSMFDDGKDTSFESAAQTKLRAIKDEGTILMDSVTTLTGIPPLAWEYKLGNRSAIEWILDQYKEKTPQDATIRERFNTYKFADYKERVIDLIKRVTNVSIKTMEIINQMPDGDNRT